jgi:hypothetical protein
MVSKFILDHKQIIKFWEIYLNIHMKHILFEILKYLLQIILIKSKIIFLTKLLNILDLLKKILKKNKYVLLQSELY